MACVRTLCGRTEWHCTNADAKPREIHSTFRCISLEDASNPVDQGPQCKKINHVAVPYIQGATEQAHHYDATQGPPGTKWEIESHLRLWMQPVSTVRLLTHVLCKPTHFFFHSFIATMSYSLQTSFNSQMKDWADKYHAWGTPARSPSRSNSR